MLSTDQFRVVQHHKHRVCSFARLNLSACLHAVFTRRVIRVCGPSRYFGYFPKLLLLKTLMDVSFGPAVFSHVSRDF